MVETDNQAMQFISSRAELASPNTDWDLTWRLARLKGLGSEATSYKHRILPSEERVARILPNSSPNSR